MFYKGDRVVTPLGVGNVAYVRMDHLGDINTPAAVSVVLDAKRAKLGYNGTIFKAPDVKAYDDHDLHS